MGYIGFLLIVAKIMVPMGIIWLLTPARYKKVFIKWVNQF